MEQGGAGARQSEAVEGWNGASPVGVAVAALQHLEDLGQQVGTVPGAQQVQQGLPAVLVSDHIIKGGQDRLQGRGDRGSVRDGGG